MNVGMLWFDNDPKADLATKISRAAAYYEKKYGSKSDLCYVHPSVLQGLDLKVVSDASGLEIRTNRSILPNHLWIGIKVPVSATTP